MMVLSKEYMYLINLINIIKPISMYNKQTWLP